VCQGSGVFAQAWIGAKSALRYEDSWVKFSEYKVSSQSARVSSCTTLLSRNRLNHFCGGYQPLIIN